MLPLRPTDIPGCSQPSVTCSTFLLLVHISPTALCSATRCHVPWLSSPAANWPRERRQQKANPALKIIKIKMNVFY